MQCEVHATEHQTWRRRMSVQVDTSAVPGSEGGGQLPVLMWLGSTEDSFLPGKQQQKVADGLEAAQSQ